MAMQSRYAAPASATAASGWQLERLTPPSRLHGANGIRTGADGRIYVAQVAGSQISAVHPDTGAIETISPLGGSVIAPDDLAFDEFGNIYATEITENRVSMLQPNGTYRVITGDMPVANPVTYHQGRLIAGELRMGARIMELDRDGGAPRVILDNVPMANAFEVGPDGKLYFPAQGANEIWRIGLDGGEPEVVATGLGVPDSVKFDAQGFIVSTQVGSGQVLRIDPRNGSKTVLAQLSPGLDNVTFLGERIFVSNATGFIVEILGEGKTREIVPDGFVWPLGLAMGDDGVLYICDGGTSYTIAPGAERQNAGNFFSAGYPGYARGVAASGPGEYIVTTGTGTVARFWPQELRSEVLVAELDQLYGVAIGAGGAVFVAELGTGRLLSVGAGAVDVLAVGLDRPKGVAIGPDGTCYIAEAGAGRVVKLAHGATEIVVDGLGAPNGILVRQDKLYIVDAGHKDLIEFDLANLPIGDPPGVTPKFIGPIGTFSGPMGLFAGIAGGMDGALYLSADAEGSILVVRPA
jgi:sugar lactone lactonase YvrE